jgi:tRNA threonylcarbamoyladenosine biosynthesis protein TsaE
MENKLLQLHYTLETIDTAVKRFWELAQAYRVLAFSGEMGAGKTTFIHHLCDYLQVQDTVSSPTFALINEYHFTGDNRDNTIYHLDWYRLRDTEEAINAGMEDCIIRAKAGEAFCFVEWPEKAPELLTPPYLWIAIESTSPGDREMMITLKSA